MSPWFPSEATPARPIIDNEVVNRPRTIRIAVPAVGILRRVARPPTPSYALPHQTEKVGAVQTALAAASAGFRGGKTACSAKMGI